MGSLIRPLVASVVVTWVFGAAWGVGEITPDQVLVVYNDRAAGARTVLGAYLAAHPDLPSGPGENVFDLDDASIAGVPQVSYGEFVGRIRDPIRAYLDAAGGPSASSIVSIVLLRGIPHRILDTDDATLGDVPARFVGEFEAGDATAASVDSELTLLWQNLGAGEAGGELDSHADNVIDNPYHQRSDAIGGFARTHIKTQKTLVNETDYGWSLGGAGPNRLTPGDMYLVCRIDGRTVEDAVAIIERAADLRVNRMVARVMIDRDSRPEPLDDGDYEATRDAMAAAKLRVVFDATANFVSAGEQPRPVIAYATYGENHGRGGGADTDPPGESPPGDGTYIDGFLFAPGAIFSPTESFSGRDLNGLGGHPFIVHEQVIDFVGAGGTFAIGHVWEPFAFSLADNEYLFGNFLVQRLTWAEAAWSSLPVLSWMDVVIGDPLARVIAVVDQPADFDGDLDVDGDDVVFLGNCTTGPGVGPPTVYCDDALLDDDVDVDQADFGVVQRCLSGAGIDADPDCAE